MLYRTIMILALTAALVVSGCAYQGPREQSGMLIGATLGGLAGAVLSDNKGGHYDRYGRWHRDTDPSAAAIIIGAMAGAAIGGSIGRSMDERDRIRASYALENVRTGVPTSWQNPDTGHAYEITPTETYGTQSGPCREYTLEADIGGERETIYGTACRQADGSWKIQDR